MADDPVSDTDSDDSGWSQYAKALADEKGRGDGKGDATGDAKGDAPGGGGEDDGGMMKDFASELEGLGLGDDDNKKKEEQEPKKDEPKKEPKKEDPAEDKGEEKKDEEKKEEEKKDSEDSDDSDDSDSDSDSDEEKELPSRLDLYGEEDRLSSAGLQPGETGAEKNTKKDMMEKEMLGMYRRGSTSSQASLYSLYMVKNALYYFQHPYCRLFIAFFVTFCNFLIFAEDPVSHSETECNIPVIGNVYSFVAIRWPSDSPGWCAAKACLVIIGIIVGCIAGKFLIHKLLLVKLLKLRMFSNEQGSWMIMFMWTIATLFIFSMVYNFLLSLDSPFTDPYIITGFMGMPNSAFMKAAACGTWAGDFFTLWMVMDIMLQEKLYPHWAEGARRWWTKGWNRVIMFWVVMILVTTTVYLIILTDWVNWDDHSPDIIKTNELGRAFLASFILVMDLLIVMQDWDFPHFESDMDIKLPGVNTAHIRINFPDCMKEWSVHITGKWFNYGIIFIVMLLDLNMWKNQIFYQPEDYGQYVHPDTSKIYSALDDFTLSTNNVTTLDYTWRVTHFVNQTQGIRYIDEDHFNHSRFFDFSLAIKCMAFIPSVAAFLAFGILIFVYGRRAPEVEENTAYNGRLKIRKKTTQVHPVPGEVPDPALADVTDTDGRPTSGKSIKSNRSTKSARSARSTKSAKMPQSARSTKSARAKSSKSTRSEKPESPRPETGSTTVEMA